VRARASSRANSWTSLGFSAAVICGVRQNISLAGFWFRLFDGRTGHVVPLWHQPLLARVLILLSWALVLVLLARAIIRAQSRPECDRAFGLTLIAMLLLSPITWDHYCVLLLLPVVLLWRDTPGWKGDRWALLVCLALLWLTPMVYWRALIGAHMDTWMTMVAVPWQTLTALSFPVYALVGLFLLGLKFSRESSASAGPALAAKQGGDCMNLPRALLPSSRAAWAPVAFVWSVWAAMLVAALAFVAAPPFDVLCLGQLSPGELLAPRSHGVVPRLGGPAGAEHTARPAVRPGGALLPTE